jgi:alkylation response protein AidB-like acyl-CoA dehydrogenase
MDARPSDEQRLLQDSAREFLARECPMGFVREQMAGARGFTDGFWRQLAELGWTGLVLPEAHGGAGLGWLELALVAEELGAALAPGPWLSSVVLGATAVERAGTPDQHARWLPPLAAGERRATLALAEPGGGALGPVRLVARESSGGDAHLKGTKVFVPDGHTADWIVVAARRGAADGPLGLAVVAGDAPGVSTRAVAYTDATRKVAEVAFDDVAVPADAWLGEGDDAGPALASVLDAARVALCAETAGLAQRVLDLSVAYAKTREQFGKPIGTFQAIQHKCADMLLRVENLRSAAWYAAWARDAGEADAGGAAAMAMAYACEAGPAVAGEGIQIHGGLGYTWEQDLHLYYKRAKANEVALGGASATRELVARRVFDGLDEGDGSIS